MKRVVKLIFKLLIWAAYKAYKAEGLNALFLVMPAKYIAPLLRCHGANIGEGVEIHSPLLIHNVKPEKGRHYENLTIGDGCYLGRDVFLDLTERITLGAHATISMRCTLLTHTDQGNRTVALTIDFLKTTIRPVHIREGAYMGAGAMILPGVTIGVRSVVGAGAVVTGSVADGVTVVGVPAGEIRNQDTSQAR